MKTSKKVIGKPISKLPYPLVLIEWQDSVLGFQGWKIINENIEKPTVFLSVGFLVHKDKNSHTLFPHIGKKLSENIAGSGDITIPNSAIKKITVLK